MGCISPLHGFLSATVNASGKRSVVFRRSLAYSPRVVTVPCGKCVECYLSVRRSWALRMVHEQKMHSRNVFVTLTYDRDHLPEGGTLVKRDFVLFMKRLRKKFGEGIRFYMCGEYGDVTLRPHYHAILFNHDFPDRKIWQRGAKPVFVSRELDAVWQNGFATCGDVTFDSCAYVAGYVMKKMKSGKSDEFYSRLDANGHIYTVLPEYSDMSRNGGIGKSWFDKFHRETYTHDSVIIDGREVRPPRFYDTHYELLDPGNFARIRRARIRRSLLNRADNTTRRLRVKELIALSAQKRKERSL